MSIFRERNVLSIVALVILAVLLHCSFFYHPPQVLTSDTSGLLSYLLTFISGMPSWATIIVFHVLILFQALWLGHIMVEMRMFAKQTHIIPMTYVLLTAIFPQWQHVSPALVSNTVVIWLLYKIMLLYSSNSPKTMIYNIGLLASCVTILYQPASILVLFCFLSLAVLRPFKVTEWFVLLLGVGTPFYFLLSVLFLNDNIVNAQKYLQIWHLYFSPIAHKTAMLISIGLVFGLTVVGWSQWQQNSSRMLIQTRKMWSLILLCLVLLTVMVFTCFNPGYRAGVLCIIPISVFASNVFLNNSKKWLPSVVFFILVINVIYNNLVL